MAKTELLGKGDKLDKYRDHLLSNAALTPEQTEMLAKYRRANALLCNGYSRLRTITILTKECLVAHGYAYSLVRDTIELFGDITKSEKDGMRYIAYENFIRAAKLAQKQKDYNAMIRAQENAARIYDLYTVSEQVMNPQDFVKPTEIIFTTDAQVLIDHQKEETIDTDYQEADDEEGK
ncbi:hypothetical protein [Adhaeribacter pallidiroseus]|uniref:Uncharacterized protein n=1 Tax=Adhaeribacter pallidiroseus TaxID=2072847 RepID=A0A369QG57_9BACT|nr:hypothetical protein [Adhaeribacter pallidiroseus]RDC63280.1 hypothetical protein AHMF7616_01882 [Adhaeribacter pallidiroseus]